jgi:hypothetical protein
VAAGEEAPGIDKKNEYPAAGLHSSSRFPQGSGKAPRDNDEVKEDPAAAANLRPIEGATAKSKGDGITHGNPPPSANVLTDNGTSEDKDTDNKRRSAADINPQGGRKAALPGRQPAGIGRSMPQKAVAPNKEPIKHAGISESNISANGISGNSISKNDQATPVKGDPLRPHHESPEQASPALNNKPESGEERFKDPVSGMNDPVRYAGKTPVMPGDISKTPTSGSRPLFADEDKKEQSQPSGLSREGYVPHTKFGALAVAEQQPEKALLQQPEKDSTSVLMEIAGETTLSDEAIGLIPTRWNIALVLAPDFSSTALERYTTPGEAYGLVAGYQFLSRFTVSTGLVRSTKKYVGSGRDYQPPEGYWQRRTNGVIPDNIRGTCAILEIPLMVQYTLQQKERSRIYLAAGLSSYIMMHESYAYTFETPNPGAATGWSTSKSSTYPFAIGHLSAAYERQFSPAWAVGLEPFLKIPFAGVGWSKVDLYSTGVFINLRYRLFRKQKITVSEERKTTQ